MTLSRELKFDSAPPAEQGDLNILSLDLVHAAGIIDRMSDEQLDNFLLKMRPHERAALERLAAQKKDASEASSNPTSIAA